MNFFLKHLQAFTSQKGEVIMSFKKITVSFVALVIALLTPLSLVSAAGYVWIWGGKVHYSSSLNAYITPVDSAHASEYIQVCNPTDYTQTFYIKDYDPDSADEYLTSTSETLYPHTCSVHWIRLLEDGSNGKAEIYIQAKSNSNGYNDVYAIYD
jgi:hypothetical protein